MRRLIAIASALALATAAGAEAPKAGRSGASNYSGDKVICKRFLRTGSLADSYKTCKTRHEWDREREGVRQLNVIDSCRDRANGGAGCS
jgi:hypothetical protein